jgi:hypothetical protein
MKKARCGFSTDPIYLAKSASEPDASKVISVTRI